MISNFKVIYSVGTEETASQCQAAMSSESGKLACLLFPEAAKLPHKVWSFLFTVVQHFDTHVCTKHIKLIEVLIYTAIKGQDGNFGDQVHVKGDASDRELIVKWQGKVTELMKDGQIKVCLSCLILVKAVANIKILQFLPVKNMGISLNAVQKAFEFMSEGKVKQQKLVIAVAN